MQKRRGYRNPMLPKRNIYVVGCGGVGSYITLGLARGYRHPGDGCDFTPSIHLIDKDVVEVKNLKRQPFASSEVGTPKAIALAKRISDITDMEVIPDVEWVTDENIRELIEDNSFIFSCVDNHKTRKIISDHCMRLENVFFVSGGNEMWDGNAQLHIRVDGEDMTPPITAFHPEIENPSDRGPWESCADFADDEPQISATNFMTASLMLALYWSPEFHELCFDIKKGKVVPYRYEPQAK